MTHAHTRARMDVVVQEFVAFFFFSSFGVVIEFAADVCRHQSNFGRA